VDMDLLFFPNHGGAVTQKRARMSTFSTEGSLHPDKPSFKVAGIKNFIRSDYTF